MVNPIPSPGLRRCIQAKNGQLVAEHRDLDVFLVWRRAEPQEVKEPADEQEGERAAHGDDLGRPV